MSRKPNLAYTVAFDAAGLTGSRMMAKLLVSSLSRTLFDGDILVFRNFQAPLFAIPRVGVHEIFIETPRWNPASQDDTQTCLREALAWRFRARNFIEAEHYDKIIYLDADCVALRNIDHLLEGEWDIACQPEARPITEPMFNGYLSDEEMSHLSCPGINAGTIAVESSRYQEVMSRWEEIFESPPAQHERFRDQTALNRLLLDTALKVRRFERAEIAFPFVSTPHYVDYRDAALVHLVGETQQRKIDLAFGLFMSAFYNDNSGLYLDFLEP